MVSEGAYILLPPLQTVFVVIHYNVMAEERDNNKSSYLIIILIGYAAVLLSLPAAITL